MIVLTMLTFKTREPQKCGIVELDSQGRMIAFHEKKQDPPAILQTVQFMPSTPAL